MFFAFSARRSTLPVRLPASRDIPRRTRNSISRKKKQSERLETRLVLVQKEFLPVTELRFGDTGSENEEGYHTLGKLLCWG